MLSLHILIAAGEIRQYWRKKAKSGETIPLKVPKYEICDFCFVVVAEIKPKEASA